MKSTRILAAALLGLAVVVVAGQAGGTAIKSGPQVGDRIPGPFHPLNITGDKSGEKHCLVCQHGTNPVAMIFGRENSPALTKLIKKLDTCTAKNTACKMGSFVVFLSDKEGLKADLTKLAKDEGIKTITLSIDNPAGPKDYEISKEADITVVLYNSHKVAANFAFAKGGLNEKAIDQVVESVSKITTK